MTYKESNSNKDKLQESLDNLYDIFKDISAHADELSRSRCPYKMLKIYVQLLFIVKTKSIRKNTLKSLYV